MSDLDEATVKSILEVHMPAIRRIVYSAWDDWRKCPGLAFERSKANVIWDYMIKHARIEFDDVPGIKVRDMPNTCFLYFEPGLIVRFKKGDANNLSKNYPTNFALDFNDPQISLPTVPKATRIEVLYHPDQEGVAIEWIRIAKRNRNEVEWWFDVDKTSEDNVQEADIWKSEKSQTKTKTKVSAKKKGGTSEGSADNSSG